ncbi:HalOD1 output domain-containing protein [Haloarcula laminariae]|uniref:HalOD1 output domain-containing protein n=1 Tax=Haloarcula laminariae TaxID=2961577 RepID=UPI0021C6FE70|nr:MULTISPECIES: HalOD1 output domain-containing protein [Halomicroarcula]
MSHSHGDVSESEAEVYHRSIFEDDTKDPTTELVTAVAELKGVEQDTLNPLYNWADHLIEHLYSTPPPAEAQGVVEFSYEGFRITLYQDGHAVIMGRNTSE